MDETRPTDPALAANAGGDVPKPIMEDQEHGNDQGAHTSAATAPPPSGNSTSFATSFQRFTDRALYFLSHASNETLGACLVGLGAGTYMILGRLGLVIIGVAGGVVLHATWEGVRGDDRDEETKSAERERRREAGVEVAKRVLDWKATSKDQDATMEDVKVYAGQQQLDFSTFGPETAGALTTFTNAIIKDYVRYWYDPTLPGEETFPASCKQTLTAFLLSLSGHLMRKRPADAFLDFVTNASSIIIVFLNELSAALNASPSAKPEEAVAAYLHLKPDSSLSYMIDQQSQENKLGDISEDVLQAYLDPKAYNCPPVHVFLKKVLAQLVLGYTVSYCSRPEFINEWIVYGLEESETTKEVMDMVDAGVEGRQPEESSAKVGREPSTDEPAARGSVDKPAQPKTPERSKHERRMSKAEDAMDEAMKEAKRLTQMMIEEDERKAREEHDRQAAASSSEDVSDSNTPGAPTPTSSQSDKERQSEEVSAWAGTDPDSDVSSATKAAERPSTPTSKSQQFTSFDQVVPNQQPTALNDSPEKPRKEEPKEPPQLTLHKAIISIFDDSQPNERASIKAKPQTDYLIQIEPSSSAFPGWMIARKFADFETLHEVLRRISAIAGVPQFVQTHPELPKWKTNTKSSLRTELERYLTDAVRFQPLAESEGMKRFLEKDQGLMKSPGAGKGFGWPTPDAFGKFGNDMMGALTKAPKSVGAGGKAVFGGVAGLVGGKKPSQSSVDLSRTSTSDSIPTVGKPVEHSSKPSDGQSLATDSYAGSVNIPSARQSQESVRSLPKQALERKASVATTASGSADLRPRPSVSSSRLSKELDRSVESVLDSAEPEPVKPVGQTDSTSLEKGPEAAYNLPPPPSEISDDFGSPGKASLPRKSTDTFRSTGLDHEVTAKSDTQAPPQTPAPSKRNPEQKPKAPLSERETSVAIELMFAVITELYTLSSAWNIRRTLLAAAKNFLLRPGNPQLLTIRDMLQGSLLDSNLSDAGMAQHILKLRENSLPTAEEMEVWKRDYPEKTEKQKEELRVKARHLLVTKGVPAALTSVMGAAASGEALGKVFDCLQVEEVGRGLVFGLVLQALRIITH
ncbi:hypothetical protein KC318_g7679 [Hortaea werneckii]|uniref:PXA domain-containing protein n=1 Tax=Hortaea werneckii TaxID=91943 RepID=A0A3M6ZCK1_HORWE|nr:hypothetical protein KC334_g7808 [Hortaea werneckii]KAI7664519.1 hypothetical protein KC318_g7679 [Hortaea werneckii]RMY12930.1 hypothetical protein D0866_14145 [Hortaea werneckii]RMY19798.1 hypothetical protein D0867_04465 [Hortaea werneckii]